MVLLESKGTLGWMNSGRWKQGQRPELTGRRPSPSEPPDQTAQPGGGHLLMGNRFQLILSGLFILSAVQYLLSTQSPAKLFRAPRQERILFQPRPKDQVPFSFTQSFRE